MSLTRRWLSAVTRPLESMKTKVEMEVVLLRVVGAPKLIMMTKIRAKERKLSLTRLEINTGKDITARRCTMYRKRISWDATEWPIYTPNHRYRWAYATMTGTVWASWYTILSNRLIAGKFHHICYTWWSFRSLGGYRCIWRMRRAWTLSSYEEKTCSRPWEQTENRWFMIRRKRLRQLSKCIWRVNNIKL